MTGTYAAALAVCGSSLAIGQAAIALSGGRRWSWLSPAVGLSVLCAVSWAAVRLPGDGVATAMVVLALTAGAVVYLWGHLDGGREALALGLPIALLALAAASVPFLVEGHFGILGTSLNPDMSQHLLAADRVAQGESGQLLNQGYPLGPHAIVVGLNDGLGIELVQGFSGLTLAVAVLAPLTALTAFSEQPSLRAGAAALLIGLPYLVASYFAQGAFKETMQALLVLAFALSLRESSRSEWAARPLRFVPAAAIAVGSVYVYSFPGLIWPAATLAIWLVLERRLPLRALSLALAVFLVGVLPELGRIIDFQSFETFDPDGPGLGNLFGQLSPFTALGIWPSGDYRLAPGDGAAPAFAYFLGAAFAALLLIYGLFHCARRRESAVLAAAAAVGAAYLAARVGGTPYTSAKALEVAAPILALAIVLPLLRRPVNVLYLLAAGGCSLLALANAPVGPTSYSPALTSLRPLLGVDPTLVLTPDRLLTEEHGTPYIAWELRGGRICIAAESSAGDSPPPGVRFVIAEGSRDRPPFPGLRLRRRSGPYAVWERNRVGGPSPCPLIAVRQARQGPAQ